MKGRWLGAMALGLLVPSGALAQSGLDSVQGVGFVGLVSGSASASQLEAASGQVEALVQRHADTPFDRTACAARLARDADVQGWRTEAREQFAHGEAALRALDTAAADDALMRARRAGIRSHQVMTEPFALARILETQALAAFTSRQSEQMHEALRLLVWVHPDAQLDPARFPPPVVTGFQQARAEVSQGDASPASGAVLSDYARRARLRFVLGGRLRVADGHAATVELDLVAADGTARRTVSEWDADALELAVHRLLEDAGVTRSGTRRDLVSAPPPRSTGAPVWYRRWYVWAAVGAVVVAGAATASATVSRGGNLGGGGPQSGTGIVFDPP